ncbi:MAG: TetR/AcrR family transcriptional regulator [Granulosicoccaceae bacterium]
MADSYHHGDLRTALIESAVQLLQEQGLEQLTLRKLAERVGVSRTGAYHHFANKNDLVCAVAAKGFVQLRAMMKPRYNLDCAQLDRHIHLFVSDYVNFASAQPELYELMFGRSIWKVGGATEELKAVAYDCFDAYAAWVEQTVQQHQPLLSKRDSLRIAQANWATLHGLCRLSLDGVYLESTDMSAVGGVVANTMIDTLRGSSTR